VKISKCNKSLIETDFPLNIPVFLQMSMSAEEHLSEGQLLHLKSTSNELKSLNYGTVHEIRQFPKV